MPHVQAGDFPEGLESFLTEHLKLLESQDTGKVIANLHSKGKNREKSIPDMQTKLKEMPFRSSQCCDDLKAFECAAGPRFRGAGA